MIIFKNKIAVNLALLGLLGVLVGVEALVAGRGEILLAANQTQVTVEGQLLVVGKKAVPKDESVSTTAATLSKQLSCAAAIALDPETKQVLFAKNEHERLYPASTTKIVTALVAREIYDLQDQLTVTASDLARGTSVGWQVGQTWRVEEILKALLVASANEAATMLANHASGGYSEFVRLMNEKVKQLNLKESSFANPQGYDDLGQQTSAWDLALLSLELLRDEVLAQIVQQKSVVITNQQGQVYPLNSTNRLMRETALPYQVLGVKTGTTDLSRESLVSLLAKEEQKILLVVLSAQNRYNDTVNLADFIFDSYLWHNPKSLP